MLYAYPLWVMKYAEEQGIALSESQVVLGVVRASEPGIDNTYKITFHQDGDDQEADILCRDVDAPCEGDLIAVISWQGKDYGVIQRAFKL